MRANDDLDLLLDSALSTYSDPGPEAGLETRVLARVTAQAAPAPRRHWLPWALALPVAACLLLLVHSGPRITQPRATHSTGKALRLQEPDVATNRSEQQPALQLAPRQGSKRAGFKAQPHFAVVVAKAARLPKLDVFPTPQPLTPEEQALAFFAANAPEPERKSLLKAQEQADAPLRIAAIHIQPLESPAQGAN